jgi:hypothetical protein
MSEGDSVEVWRDNVRIDRYLAERREALVALVEVFMEERNVYSISAAYEVVGKYKVSDEEWEWCEQEAEERWRLHDLHYDLD